MCNLKRPTFVNTIQSSDSVPHMHHKVDPKLFAQETAQYATATTNPPLSSRSATSSSREAGNLIATPSELSTAHDANHDAGVEQNERLSLPDDRGSRKPGLRKEQLRLSQESGLVRPRRDMSYRIEPPPPKSTVAVTQPVPVCAMATESIPRPSATFQQLYETQSKELSELRDKLQVADKEKRALSAAYGSLSQQHEEMSRKLSLVNDEHQALLKQKDRAEMDCAAFKQKYDEAIEQGRSVEHHSNVIRKESGVENRDEQCTEIINAHDRLQKVGTNHLVLDQQPQEESRSFGTRHYELQRVLEEKGSVQNDYAVLRQDYTALREQYDALRLDYQSLKAAFEQCRSELHGVEKFLITADSFSGAEVVDMLRKLNIGIQQSITSMAEWIVDNLTLGADVQIVEHTRTSELLGMRIMGILGVTKHRDNPTLLEIVLQAYLTYELQRVASQRTNDESHIAFIDGICQRMREAEGQAISGNWRALTNLYISRARFNDLEIARTINATIVSGISDVVLAAGCTASKPEITSLLGSKFAKEIHELVLLAAHINKIVGSGVVSEDFEVLVVQPETPFDVAMMEDWDSGGVNFKETLHGVEGKQETVLCAAELGLMRRTKGEPSTIMIKPKVMLVSVLDIINEYCEVPDSLSGKCFEIAEVSREYLPAV